MRWATGQKNIDASTVMAITQQQPKVAQTEKELLTEEIKVNQGTNETEMATTDTIQIIKTKTEAEVVAITEITKIEE